MIKPAVPGKLPMIGIDWAALMPAVGEANRALARFDGMLTHMPNPHLLRTPLLTREAVLSSRIEGTLATVSEVFRFEAGDEPAGEQRRLDIEEIVNYRLALDTAQHELTRRPFSLNLILKLHKVLLTSVRGHNKAPGEFRRVQNYIGRPGASIGEASFVPPTPDRMLTGLHNWETYYHADDKDVLVQLALLHAQFEFLHPFLDGNGRIGRILIPIFLYERHILSSPTFYLSEYLEEHRDEYLDRLAELSKGVSGWNRWCQFFVNGMTVQAEWNIHRVQAVLKLYQRMNREIFSITSSRAAQPLLDALFSQPVLQASTLLSIPGMPKRPQLMVLLERLVAAGLLRILSPNRGSHGAVYSLHELVKLCESKPRSGSKTGKKSRATHRTL